MCILFHSQYNELTTVQIKTWTTIETRRGWLIEFLETWTTIETRRGWLIEFLETWTTIETRRGWLIEFLEKDNTLLIEQYHVLHQDIVLNEEQHDLSWFLPISKFYISIWYLYLYLYMISISLFISLEKRDHVIRLTWDFVYKTKNITN